MLLHEVSLSDNAPRRIAKISVSVNIFCIHDGTQEHGFSDPVVFSNGGELYSVVCVCISLERT
jgi:hypothetical protein